MVSGPPLLLILAATLTFLPVAARSQDRTAVEAVRTGVLSTCYGQVAGDPKAAEHSVAAGDLEAGAPKTFAEEPLNRLLQAPGGAVATAYQVPTDQGAVLVVDAPSVSLCSVALSGASGEAAGAEIDLWFNGEPSPFSLVGDETAEYKRVRTYRGSERPDVEIVIMTTTVADGALPDEPVRFLATLARVR